MRQRRWRSRNVLPAHFLFFVQICAHSASHSCTFCACPLSCLTLSSTGTRSVTPLVMTSAHCLGRLSPSPLAATPPAPHNAENCCVCSPSPLANGASRQEVLTPTLQWLSLLTRIGGHHHSEQQRAATPPLTSAPPPPPTAQALLSFPSRHHLASLPARRTLAG
jgi:hypothetical protein